MPPPKQLYRYFIVDDYGNVVGTNDPIVARQAFFNDNVAVIDSHTGESFEEPDEETTGDIRFAKVPAYTEQAP